MAAETEAKIRVLVVDDSAVMRRIIATALSRHPALEVVGYAANGLQAIAQVRELQPDVLTLDMDMPELDGLGALREIRQASPRLPIIMFSSLTQRGAPASALALAAGASDYVCKPSNTNGSMDAAFDVLEAELIPKILGLAQRAMRRTRALGPLAPAPLARSPRAQPPATAGLASPPAALWRPSQIPLPASSVAALVIGVSTGGPLALKQIFGLLATPLPVPVFIVQHMPPAFTPLLAARLSGTGPMGVKEAQHGEVPQAGTAYLAPGGQHLALALRGQRVCLVLSHEPPVNSCRPSVDVLFESAAQVYGPGLLALVLTGMGYDGVRGCQEIKARSGQVLVQDEKSSVVWGMAGAVAQLGLADMVLPLDKIPDELRFRTRQAPRPKAPHG